MSSLFTEQKLIIATHNAGKVKEFARLINLDGLQLIAAGDLNLPEPEETGSTFAENAQLKSRAAALAAKLPALADDSGICVDGLDGAPGIYSARWAVNKDFKPAFERIKNELAAKNIAPNGAKASFVCVLSLTLPDGKTLMAQGQIDGHLCFPPRGEQGFGYDPIFIPAGETRSYAEMSGEEKNRYSHRALAVAALKKQF